MARPRPTLDDIDHDILAVLARDGRIGWQALGPRVGLSANAAAERVRRLERAGVITGYTVRVDPIALGGQGRGAQRQRSHRCRRRHL